MDEQICGECKEIVYDNKITHLNLELVKVCDKDGNCHFEIHFQDWSKEDKMKVLFKLHVEEAIELKCMIDKLLYNSLEPCNTDKN